LDKYQRNSDSLNAQNDPISGYTNGSHDYHEVPNGAFYNVTFTDPAGTVLAGTVAGAYTTPNGYSVNTIDGVPVSTDQGAGVVNGLYSVYLVVRSTEKLVLSPFVFAEQFASDTGLFGINNIQIVMNMRDPNRALRLRDSRSGSAVKQYYSGGLNPATWLPPVSYNNGVSTGAFQSSVINVQFLTPSLDIPLPPKRVVPYMEDPRYITAPQNAQIPAGQVQQIQSQTITLPQIPDLLIIYCKALPDTSSAAYQADRSLDPTLHQFGSAYLPIATSVDGTRSPAPLSINFDNFSGLLSSQTSEQLYAMSVRNGLEIDWNTWAGLARVPSALGGRQIPTVGGFLVLKPSMDLTLQSGQAPSLVGNFTLQFNVQVRNTFPFSVVPQLFVITANSGFFESVRGSSRIIKGVLSEQDIIAAPLSSAGTREGLARMIGGKMMAMANRLGFMKGHSSPSASSGSVEGRGREAVSQKMAALPRGVAKGLASRLM
jgi:hypothetical protein